MDSSRSFQPASFLRGHSGSTQNNTIDLLLDLLNFDDIQFRLIQTCKSVEKICQAYHETKYCLADIPNKTQNMTNSIRNLIQYWKSSYSNNSSMPQSLFLCPWSSKLLAGIQVAKEIVVDVISMSLDSRFSYKNFYAVVVKSNQSYRSSIAIRNFLKIFAAQTANLPEVIVLQGVVVDSVLIELIELGKFRQLYLERCIFPSKMFFNALFSLQRLYITLSPFNGSRIWLNQKLQEVVIHGSKSERSSIRPSISFFANKCTHLKSM